MNTQPAENSQPEWQQPSFAEPTPPPMPGQPVWSPGTGHQLANMPLQPMPMQPMPMPAVQFRPPPPPSSFETVITVLGRVLWPVWAILTFLGPLHFLPGFWIALVASIVLQAIRRTVRQNRLSNVVQQPIQAPPASNDLR